MTSKKHFLSSIWELYAHKAPDKSGEYVVITDTGSIHTMHYSFKHDMWNVRDYEEKDFSAAIDNVVCWARLEDVYPPLESLRETWLFKGRYTSQ